ncbi:MAG: SH3 domain-containing protein [Pseudomonadota bacterium]
MINRAHRGRFSRGICRIGHALAVLSTLGLGLAQAETPPATTETAEVAQSSKPQTGPETNLPLPRFVSMKAKEGNVRRGPSLTHRIDWVFKHRNMPLEITGEYGHWRRVRDRDGAGGWMHYSLLSGARTVIIEEDLAPVLSHPTADAPIRAHAELGVIARLEGCERDWCRVRMGRTRGWMSEDQLWGVSHAPLE